MPAKEFTAQDWIRLRKAFAVSMMSDTTLDVLAQNVEAGRWPLAGADETPAKYVDYTWDELQRFRTFREDPALLALLLRILDDNLAFDEPFQRMIEEHAAEGGASEALRTLRKFDIPEDFPIELVRVSAGVHDFCSTQGITTLGGFSRAAEKIAQVVIVTGDFRQFLQALASGNDALLAAFIPLRPGEKGLHLAESLHLAYRALPEAVRLMLAKAGGAPLTREQLAAAATATEGEIAVAERQLRDALVASFAWFRHEAADWRVQPTGNALEHRLRPLGDVLAEKVLAGQLRKIFSGKPVARASAPPQSEPLAATQAPEEKTGLLARIRRWFGR